MSESLPRVTRVAAAGDWPAEHAAATLTLPYAERHLRRRRLVCDDGTALLLDLPRARLLAAGDGLDLGDGRWIRIEAAAEPVIEATARDPRHLARLAWHLGNRHCPAQILDGAVRVLADEVLAEMLAGLGAEVVRRDAPFVPEPGAYAQPGEHHHHHDHGDAG